MSDRVLSIIKFGGRLDTNKDKVLIDARLHHATALLDSFDQHACWVEDHCVRLPAVRVLGCDLMIVEADDVTAVEAVQTTAPIQSMKVTMARGVLDIGEIDGVRPCFPEGIASLDPEVSTGDSRLPTDFGQPSSLGEARKSLPP